VGVPGRPVGLNSRPHSPRMELIRATRPSSQRTRIDLRGSSPPVRIDPSWTRVRFPDRISPRTEGRHMANVSITVNGKARAANVEPRMLLAHFLREELQLTGTHIGCDTSQCGACTVLIDGRSAKSCTIFAVQADGASVTTIEGLAKDGALHPLQEGFWEEHGLQCGYCTPGMIMS